MKISISKVERRGSSGSPSLPSSGGEGWGEEARVSVKLKYENSPLSGSLPAHSSQGESEKIFNPAPAIPALNSPPSTLNQYRRPARAFTILEIALCLGIIAFALIAILGVLPLGLSVQKENRQETIMNQDAVVWMDAIRNGSRGYDDLTNYVIGITNYWTQYKVNPNPVYSDSGSNGYSYFGSTVTPDFPLTNGYRIIGLLSTPKYVILGPTGNFQSNYIVAYIRAVSGAAVEKPPQDDSTIRGDAFSYKLIMENASYVPFDPNSTNYTLFPNQATTNAWRLMNTMQTDTHDLRLTFRWPILPNGDLGSGRQTFRALTGGHMTNYDDSGQTLYFLQPSTYVQAP
jgi:type II secretory pathway pseudopilin PulG